MDSSSSGSRRVCAHHDITARMTRDELVAWFNRRIGPNDTVTIFAQCSHDGQTARVLAAAGFVNRELQTPPS